jgi:hypothetical protein
VRSVASFTERTLITVVSVYELILVLVLLFSVYKRYRYGTSAVAPLGMVLSLIADRILLFTGRRARNGEPDFPIQ